MFKRRAIFFAVLATIALTVLPAAAAVGTVPLEVDATRESGVGVDRIFDFDVTNTSDRVLFARGRVVLLNVYAASLPVTIAVPDVRLAAGATTTVSVRWQNAPLIGQIRALLVLNDGVDPSLVQAFVYWVFPIEQAALFVGIAAATAALALGILRLPKYLKKVRVPSGMSSYVVEEDDTVVTLSSRFDVTWQDIVRANRLKPPYTLKIGRRILIPKHDLRKPPSEPIA